MMVMEIMMKYGDASCFSVYGPKNTSNSLSFTTLNTSYDIWTFEKCCRVTDKL